MRHEIKNHLIERDYMYLNHKLAPAKFSPLHKTATKITCTAKENMMICEHSSYGLKSKSCFVI